MEQVSSLNYQFLNKRVYSMIFVIDDDYVMAECIARAVKRESRVFSNVIEAMEAISDGEVPEIVFLDVLLDGPDGFTFLNEIMSYEDTAKIPIVIVSSLDLDENLSSYGVVGVLKKETMKPKDIYGFVKKYSG